MNTREVAEILAAAEGATTAMSREGITRMTDTMMDATAMALGTAEVARTTEAGNSSNSSPEDGQTGATQADEVTCCTADICCTPHSVPAVYMPCPLCMSLCLCNALEGTKPFLHIGKRAAHLAGDAQVAREEEGGMSRRAERRADTTARRSSALMTSRRT